MIFGTLSWGLNIYRLRVNVSTLSPINNRTPPFLTSVMADPVAGRSGFLCMYMSSHPDTLVAYVKHFGKVDGNVSSAKMLSIDSKVRAHDHHVRSSVRPSLQSAREMGR